MLVDARSMISMESVNPSSVLPSPTSNLVLTENKIKQNNLVFVVIFKVQIVVTLEVTLIVTVALI